MAKQKARAFLIKISDGAAAFTAFAGLTGKSLKINSERIDATTPDATSPEGAYWTETLDDVKSVSVSGDATLVDDASEARLIEIAMSAAAVDAFQIVVPGWGTFEGDFSVNVEISGDGKVTFSMSLESTGEITFTAQA
jgi:TP901-1 family phage major tail protein